MKNLKKNLTKLQGLVLSINFPKSYRLDKRVTLLILRTMKSGKQYRKEHGIGATRLKLGLTLKALAMELGISESMLSRVEQGERRLSAGALAKLSSIEIEMAAVISVQNKRPYQEVWSEVEKKSLAGKADAKAVRCRQRAAFLQASLNRMQDRYNKICKSLGELESLINSSEGSGDPLNFKPGHLQKHRDVLETKFRHCGKCAQIDLHRKITLLHAEADLYAADAASFMG